MLIDIIVLILLSLALWKGIRKGLVMGIFSLLAFVVGLAAAIKLSAIAANYIGTQAEISGRILPVVAFLLVFILVALLVRLGGKAIESTLQLAMLGWANRLGGFIFYGLLYLFIFSILLFYAHGLELIKPDTARASLAFPYLSPMGPKVMEGLGALLPFFKNAFNELGNFFEQLK